MLLGQPAGEGSGWQLEASEQRRAPRPSVEAGTPPQRCSGSAEKQGSMLKWKGGRGGGRAGRWCSAIISTDQLLDTDHVHQVLGSWRQTGPHLLHQTLHLLHVDGGTVRRAGRRLPHANDDSAQRNAAASTQRQQLGRRLKGQREKIKEGTDAGRQGEREITLTSQVEDGCLRVSCFL